MNPVDKNELARLVFSTERRLHRYCVSRFVSETQDDTPSPALTFPQVQMIMTVHDSECLTLKQLAAKLQVQAPAASTMVDRLVELNVLTRTPNPDDRREVLIRVSADHERKIEKMEQRALQTYIEVLDAVGPDYVEMWRKLGVRLDEVLLQLSGGGEGA